MARSPVGVVLGEVLWEHVANLAGVLLMWYLAHREKLRDREMVERHVSGPTELWERSAQL